MSFVAERLIMVRFLFLLFVLSACRNAAISADDVVINDFESDTFGTWIVEGEAFGPGPVQGTVDGQMPVSGVLGKGVANSFRRVTGLSGPSRHRNSQLLIITSPFSLAAARFRMPLASNC